jgi:fibronectin-binding autotransporter adhesin
MLSGSTQFVALQGDGDIEYAGVISGTMQLTRSSTGIGTLTLSGNNTYSGRTQVSNGTLLVNGNALAASGVLGTNINLNLSPSSSLTRVLTNGAFTIGKSITSDASASNVVTLGGATANVSSFTGNIALASSSFFTQAAGGTVNFSGGISGTAAGTQLLTISGAGTVVFDGANKTYNYNTTIISTAKLLVNTGLASPAVTVNGTLGGNGNLAGTVSVAAAGNLTPGTSVGTLTMAGLTLDPASFLNFELAAPNIVGGTTNDLLSVGGAR